MKDKRCGRLLIMIMGIIIISTAVVTKYADRIFTQKSKTVTETELKMGYAPTLFEPCYMRPESTCNYDSGMVEADENSGIMLSGPNITLEKGDYILFCDYEIYNEAELKDTNTYLSIAFSGKSPISVEGQDSNRVELDGNTLTIGAGHIQTTFQVEKRTENINWTFYYQDGIKMGVKSVTLMERG